jgi:hypothetical protein
VFFGWRFSSDAFWRFNDAATVTLVEFTMDELEIHWPGRMGWCSKALLKLLVVLIKGVLSVDCYIYMGFYYHYICMGFYYHKLRVHVQNPFRNLFSLGAFVLLIARKWDDAPMMHPAVETPAWGCCGRSLDGQKCHTWNLGKV